MPHELLLQCFAGDQQAWQILYEIFQTASRPAYLRYLRAFKGEPIELEDLQNDFFARLMSDPVPTLGKFEGTTQAALSAFLYGCASHHARQCLRSLRRLRERQWDASGPLVARQSVEGLTEQQILLIINEILPTLPEPYRLYLLQVLNGATPTTPITDRTLRRYAVRLRDSLLGWDTIVRMR